MNASTTTKIIGFSQSKTYAMIKLSINPFDAVGRTVYVRYKDNPVIAGKKVGDEITIPEGWKTVTRIDHKTGETFKFSDSVEQLYLTY